MTVENIITLLGWSSIINVSLLLYSFLMVIFAKKTIYYIHSRLFNISNAQIDQALYWIMGSYKVLIILLNVVPYIVLKYLM
tara:strand:- start:75 stop:317 length:243 start_codon:yes stop_codon:yes gene_type:complete